MPLTFTVSASKSCSKNPSVYAIPYLLHGLNTVGPVEALDFGADVPDLTEPAEFLVAVQRGLANRVQRRNLMAVDIFNLCNLDHSEKPKPSRRGRHRMERIGSVILAHQEAQPISVYPQRRRDGSVDLHVTDPSRSPGPIRPVVFMERTSEEQSSLPITHIIRSVPFGSAFDRGFVALDGIGTLYYPAGRS